VPKLTFKFDESVGRGRHMEDLLGRARASDALHGNESRGGRQLRWLGVEKVEPVTGILVLDKPIGPSSNQVLQRVRHLFGAAKAGHTGNLDPLASGVLPICLGEATKLSQYLLDSDKAYEARVLFRLQYDNR